ncbi:polysaccharide deacetylase family protein [Gilvimarinus chinensis]|uniref:polysaccharide deacetylase family protein n=1 Tax=Gilvimarinus chinensis TaxID=396005 RepID=UPI00037EC6DD|nr:polysaccharide deacetylase family protein [Gilvimarinus chinensis]
MRIFISWVTGLSLSLCASLGQAESQWNGKSAAVVLTYDDSLNVHLDTVIPALDQRNLKGTFYITLASQGFSQRIDEWRSAAANGHELGNHTLFHPCNGQGAGRSWVSSEQDLSTWSVDRMVRHLEVANTALQAVDGKTKRTYAYPCGDMTAGGESYVDAIKPLFVGARGVVPGFPPAAQTDRYDIASHVVNGQSIEALKALVNTAIGEKGLLVFLFHGVGGEHSMNVDTETHNQLLDYLRQQQDQLWIAPMLDIAQSLP